MELENLSSIENCVYIFVVVQSHMNSLRWSSTHSYTSQFLFFFLWRLLNMRLSHLLICTQTLLFKEVDCFQGTVAQNSAWTIQLSREGHRCWQQCMTSLKLGPPSVVNSSFWGVKCLQMAQNLGFYCWFNGEQKTCSWGHCFRHPIRINFFVNMFLIPIGWFSLVGGHRAN